MTVADSVLIPQCLRPEWGEGAIGQDGQVTILDLPKAHGIPYMEVYSLQPCTLLYNKSLSFHASQLMEISNLIFSRKGRVREYYSCGLEYCLSPSLRSNP